MVGDYWDDVRREEVVVCVIPRVAGRHEKGGFDRSRRQVVDQQSLIDPLLGELLHVSGNTLLVDHTEGIEEAQAASLPSGFYALLGSCGVIVSNEVERQLLVE